MPDSGDESLNTGNRNRNPNSSNMDESNAMMTSMAEYFALQQSTFNIPYFDGKNIPLKDFLQDVHNGVVCMPSTAERLYVKTIIGKLKGTARDSTYGKTFNTVDELTKHLKTRFASGKTFSYYQHEIENIRMKRNEAVSDFYDRLNILISGARVALEDKYGNQAEQMLKPVIDYALDAFLRGLPDEMARSVDTRDPKTLEEALKYAVRIENRTRAGILPGGETPRSVFSRPVSPNYNNTQYNQQRNFSDFQNPARNYSNYFIADETETRARSPSPNALKNPTGILRRQGSPEPRNYPYNPTIPVYTGYHSGYQPGYQAQYSRYQYPPFYPVPYPYGYPPIPYSCYPPFGYPENSARPTNHQISDNNQVASKPSMSDQRSNSPTGRLFDPNKSTTYGSWRQNNSVNRSRSPSPHKPTEHLNSQAARRVDATAGQVATTERQTKTTVRFAEPAHEYSRAEQIENRY